MPKKTTKLQPTLENIPFIQILLSKATITAIRETCITSQMTKLITIKALNSTTTTTINKTTLLIHSRSRKISLNRKSNIRSR